MKLVRPSVLPPARTGSCLVLALLLALPLAPRPASALNCNFGVPGDCGDEWGFSCLFATVDMLAYNACLKARVRVTEFASFQQWFDWLPASLAAEDGGPGGGDIWHWKTADEWNFLNVATNARTANPGSWPGFATLTEYPTRTRELVHSFLGDGPVPDADTDTYQFAGMAGSNVVICLAQEIWIRCQSTPRPGDAILTLTAPDGVTVLKRARSLVPVELRATLPADGTYTLAVSQRAGSARSYAGNYRLTFRHAASVASNTLVADVETAQFRTTLDPEFDQAPQPVTPSAGSIPRPVAVIQCSENVIQMPKCIMGAAVTASLEISPSFPYYASGIYVTNGISVARYWVRAVGFKKTPCYIAGVASMGPAFGIAGMMDMDCTANIKPGWTVLTFAP